jgi:CHAT domain-containing protein
MLAVFADPVFDRQDPRLKSSGTPAPGAAPRAPQFEELPRLLFSRREALAILSLVPASERFEAMDFAADRAAATAPALGDYRYVHFATHGFFNSRHPELSGLVMSLVDPQGRPRDGFLSARDVFGLDLSAEVVVLSACRTALGKEVQGEGLVGITRGFLHAGSRRVVASLWRVDDVATAELMKRFYAAMLRAPRSSPAAALRSAQVALSKTDRWRDPYYWAGFLIQGEWN